MSEEPAPLNRENKNENDKRRGILLALLFLLFTCVCVVCSSQSALWFVDTLQIQDNMLARQYADYGPGSFIALAPIDRDRIIAEIMRDEEVLLSPPPPDLTGAGGAMVVALLPKPNLLPTPPPVPPIPTPTTQPVNTEDTVPVSNPAQPLPAEPSVEPTVPPATAPPPQPTIPVPTAVPPTAPVPTVPPPTVPVPTVPAPTVPAPTVPPPTVPPPTSPPPTSPPPSPVNIAFNSVNYSVNESDGSVTITVNLNTASSQSVTVNYTTSDITALAGSDYTATIGTLVFAPGQTSRTFVIPVNNDGIVELSETFRITLSAPVNGLLGAPAVATITIIDNSPSMQFSAGNYTINESGGTATITATLSAASANTITATYATSNGSATAGSDYTAAGGTLTFLPGQTTATFPVAITDDNLSNEGNETINLTLSNLSGATLGTPHPAVLTIIDNDSAQVEFAAATYSVNENGGTATITVTLNAPSAMPINVNYVSSNNTAIAGSDYTAVSNTLTIAPNLSSAIFTVPIINDILANENTETLTLTLSNAVNATLGPTNPATLEIVDDDSVTVQFVKTQYSVNEGNDGGTGFVTTTVLITLSNPSAVPVSVNYTTSDGSATITDGDYIAAGGTLIFAPSETHKSFFVTIVNDANTESTETLGLAISAPVSATLGTPASATLTIIDDDSVAGSCSGTIPAGEPNIGPPNGVFAEIDCGAEFIITLPVASEIVADGNSDFDLIYYEYLPPPGSQIFMDQVIVQIGPGAAGPWYSVFYWGDNILDENTNIGQAGYGPPESNNFVIPSSALYNSAGIAIDVDARVPAGTYSFVRIYTPFGTPDPAEVDAVEVP